MRNDYSRDRYEAERRSEHRTFARDHSYPEWVRFKQWEAGEEGYRERGTANE